MWIVDEIDLVEFTTAISKLFAMRDKVPSFQANSECTVALIT